MAKEKQVGRVTQNTTRQQELLQHHFTPLEAKLLRELPRNNSARTRMITARDERWERFTSVARGKVARGRWREDEVKGKWAKNLSRFYSRNHLRVQYGPAGKQDRIPRGAVNPWALYRFYERQFGGPDGKRYVSPWQIKQLKTGKTPFQKGLIFVQGVERKLREGNVSKKMIRSWLEQKEEAVRGAKGKHKTQLQIECRRLERLI